MPGDALAAFHAGPDPAASPGQSPYPHQRAAIPTVYRQTSAKSAALETWLTGDSTCSVSEPVNVPPFGRLIRQFVETLWPRPWITTVSVRPMARSLRSHRYVTFVG